MNTIHSGEANVYHLESRYRNSAMTRMIYDERCPAFPLHTIAYTNCSPRLYAGAMIYVYKF